MNEFVKKILDKLNTIWNAFSNLKTLYKILLIASIVVIFIVSVVTITWSSKETYIPLFQDLSPIDASNIVTRLKEWQVPYKVSGTTISVPFDQHDMLKIKLAGEGVLPTYGIVGLEIFDKTKLSMTDYERKMNFLRGMQGELTRIIKSLDAVQDARVIIVLPEPKLYIEDQKPPTASIKITLKSGETLKKSLIQGIINLASTAVEGLTPDNITVVDSRGETLSDNLESDVGSDKPDKIDISAKQLEIQRRESKRIEAAINRKLMKILGTDKVEAFVKVELNFDSLKGKRKEYQPVLIPKKDQFAPQESQDGLFRSKKKVKESYTSKGNVVGGLPGVDANVPGYKSITDDGTTYYAREEEIINNEVNEHLMEYENQPVKITRVSIAVFIDWKTVWEKDEQGLLLRKYKERTKAEMKKYYDLVKAIVGYNSDRNDLIEVKCVQFNREKEMLAEAARIEKIRRAARNQKIFLMLLTCSVAFIILFLIGAELKKRGDLLLAESEKQKMIQSANARLIALSEMRERESSLAAAERDELKQRVINFIHSKPEIVASLIRNWLRT